MLEHFRVRVPGAAAGRGRLGGGPRALREHLHVSLVKKRNAPTGISENKGAETESRLMRRGVQRAGCAGQ